MRPIGAASTMSGVNIETIRYYEREGIVPRAERTPAGRRLYGDADIARLRFVKRCRDLGFSVPDIRTLLELSAGNGAPCADVKALGERHLHGVRRKLDALGKLERALAELVRRCDAGRTDCPMLEKTPRGLRRVDLPRRAPVRTRVRALPWRLSAAGPARWPAVVPAPLSAALPASPHAMPDMARALLKLAVRAEPCGPAGMSLLGTAHGPPTEPMRPAAPGRRYRMSIQSPPPGVLLQCQTCFL